MGFMFEQLEVYKKALSVAEEITNITAQFPKGTYYLSNQLNRAVTSISANIAEGNGRWHKNDRRQFFYIARGSAHECVPLLDLCMRKGLITQNECSNLKNELLIIVKMIYGLINGIDKRKQ
ncbi:MAG: four helix bundle protein [Planctomycetes bacterium]|nr:four helix bundle protein [Planctomycetota bacterium]